MTTTDTRSVWRVVAPTSEGSYYVRFGWRVVNEVGYCAMSGDEAGARQYARALNLRAAREAARDDR